MIPQKPDQELLEIYRERHDSEVIGLLFTRYTDLVYGVCLKYLKDRNESQDAVMNIFERLIEKLKTEKVEYFKSWLYMVSRNHCLMILRKNHPEKLSDFMELTLVDHPIDEGLDLESDLVTLEKCLDALKSEQERCVRLFYLKQMSYQEVSEQTMFSLKSVKSFIQNGKRNLKICMDKKIVE